MHLILYSKPGCHLCEGLHEKLTQITEFPLELEVRDITTQPEWFERYQYEIPVLFAVQAGSAMRIPRLSPRASVQQVARMLQKSCKI